MTFLRAINDNHRSIHLEISLGRCVHFFGAQIENRQGQLYTRVSHPSSTVRPSLLPYVVDHAQSSHRQWFRWALIRAVRFCSNVDDFIQERISLEMACLANGYSSRFVETQLTRLFQDFDARSMRFVRDPALYDQLRRRCFDFIDKQRSHLDTYQKLQADERVIDLYYFYQNGAQEKFCRQFHQIWSTYLAKDPQLSNEKTRINLKPKHVYSLNALLAQQKPPCPLLQLS